MDDLVKNFDMVQFCRRKVTSVGNGLRAVPPGLERHGGRSLQNRPPKCYPTLNHARISEKTTLATTCMVG